MYTAAEVGGETMKEAIVSLAVFAGGTTLGRFVPGGGWIQVLPTLSLLVLTFVVGVDMGRDRSYIAEVRRHSVWVFALPVLVAIGSLLSASLAVFFLRDITLRQSLLVSAGLGYYSLASVLIAAHYSAALGSIALLSNILREIMTLLLAPLLVRYFGTTSVIAAGAATAMDATLPTIRRVGGPSAVYPALVTGMVLTLAVPFLLTLLIKL